MLPGRDSATQPAPPTAEEERRLEVDVDLEVPVVLGDLVDVAAPAQDRGDVGEVVEPTEALQRLVEDRLVERQVAEVPGQCDVQAVAALQAGARLLESGGIEVDGHHVRAGGAERLGDRPADTTAPCR